MDVVQHSAAMLSMKRIKLVNQRPLVVCGFTDGAIRVYAVSGQGGSSLILKHESLQVHGFGVNTMDAVTVDQTSFLVITGGDDQHIVCSLYE